jgi:dimethylglycine dehydrogenase
MLNERGKLIGDFTIARASDTRFLIWGSLAASKYHMRWFERHLPADGSVHVHRFHTDLVGLMLAGPKSREVLAALVDADVSNAAFRFMDFREMDVAGAPCMVNRITYTGDLGYEIWMKPSFQRRVYLAIKEAGQAHGIVDFGMRALLSMRLEKNFPTWFAELRPIYGPFEGAMDRFVKLQKPDFIGREAAVAERDAGPRLRRVSLMIEAGMPMCWATSRSGRRWTPTSTRSSNRTATARRASMPRAARCRAPTRCATATGGSSAG